jgi:hypothetical protein
MVQDRLSDGKRIAQLLASELTGDQATLAHVVVADADPDVEPTADGAFAYRVVHAADSDALTTDDRGRPTLAADAAGDVDAKITEIATVSVLPERARVTVSVASDRAAAAAAETELQTLSTDAADTRLLVTDGVEAKRILPVFEAVVDTLSADSE